MSERKIGVLHPGEMGLAVAKTAQNSRAQVYWASEGRSPETRRRAAGAGLADAGTLRGMTELCPVIVSICPPEFAEGLASQVAGLGFRGLYIDANAISPDRVRRMGECMVSQGIAFVDACVIGLPATARGETWLYLSGPHAGDAAPCFCGGPLEVEALAGDIGHASALKMCFAAHAKGLAALRAAVLGAAEELGVLADLQKQWERNGTTFAAAVASLQHTAPKAWRFVAEMKEIAATFESAGMPGEFHLAAAEIFARLAPFKGAGKPELRDAIDKLKPGSAERAAHGAAPQFKPVP
jgi:3-hydroxyisobutyrate dehydrogenase-like beta-hydroxyacid dehydrogenase